MRKWFTSVVALSMLVGTVGAPAAPVAAETEQTFTVVLKGSAISQSALDAIQNAGGTVESSADEIGVLSVKSSNPSSFLKAMLANGEVQAVAPSLMVELEASTADEEILANDGTSPAIRSNPDTYTWGVERVTNNRKAWEIHQGTHDVVVGVIDTGFDFGHPDLVANILPGSKTFVPGTTNARDGNSHGTHVAGTIAANGRIKGVAPGVGLRAYRVFGNTGGAAQVWITNAIVAAANDGVDVINMSLGGKRVMGQWWAKDPVTGERTNLGGDHADWVAYHRAVQYAVKKNVTLIVSAGNDGWDLANKNDVTAKYNAYLDATYGDIYDVEGATFIAPGGVPGVVMVSSTGGGWGTADRLAYYSNYGNGAVNVAGPGGDIGPNYPAKLDTDYWKYYTISTVPTYMPCSLSRSLFGNCNYGWKVGTSMAAPHVSGVAALIISQQYALTGQKPSPAQVMAKLQQSSEDLGKVGFDNLYGHGLANAYNALGGK